MTKGHRVVGVKPIYTAKSDVIYGQALNLVPTARPHSNQNSNLLLHTPLCGSTVKNRVKTQMEPTVGCGHDLGAVLDAEGGQLVGSVGGQVEAGPDTVGLTKLEGAKLSSASCGFFWLTVASHV